MQPPVSEEDSTRRSERVAELYAQHGEKLRSFLFGLLRNGDLAGEALQNTFRQAVRAVPEATPDGVRGWLFRVAYNEAMLIRRKAKIASQALQKVAEESAGDWRVPDDPLVRVETIGRVREALKGLPLDQRNVVEQRIYGEKTFAVIASELKLPLGTVLTRMRLAMEKLRAALGE
jgi:RNA polymerase sigma factor (sigma-70 family)